jgi:hypothetical protein
MRFTALLHHLTVGLLRDSFYALKRKAAPGVDGVTWQEYETCSRPAKMASNRWGTTAISKPRWQYLKS